MVMPDLPALPIPELPDNIYADDQIRQYGALCRKQALEEAARICDKTPPHPFRPSIEAAHAIRRLI